MVPQVESDLLHLSADLSLYLEHAGHGPDTIVLVPGWCMSTEVFARQLKYFAASDRYRAITYDPRGQRLSSKTVDGHNYIQCGHDLAALLDRLVLDRVVLAGWSSGVFDCMAYVNLYGIQRPRGPGEDPSREWVWFYSDDLDHTLRNSTSEVFDDRITLNADFARWMLEAATPESLRWIDRIAN